MRLFRTTTFSIAVFSLAASAQIPQIAPSYNGAAAAASAAAAACPNPVGAACLRQYASYYRCLSSQLGSFGGSCGSGPSCNNSCLIAGKGGALVNKATSSSALEKLSMGIGIAIALKGLYDKDHQPEVTDPHRFTDEQIAAQQAAQQAADEALEKQMIDAEAARILDQANAVVANTIPANASPQPPDSNAAVSDLLGLSGGTTLGPPANAEDATAKAVSDLLSSDTTAAKSSPAKPSTTPYDASMQRARKLMDQDRMDDAIAEAQRARAQDPKRWESYAVLSVALRMQNKSQESDKYAALTMQHASPEQQNDAFEALDLDGRWQMAHLLAK